MNSNSKRFFNNMTTTKTDLRCSIGSNLLIPPPGTFSLGFEYREEHPPRCIGYAFCEMPVLNHIVDIKVFYCKAIIGIYERARNLVTEIKSLIGNLFMKFSNQDTGFSPAVRTFLPLAKLSLSLDKHLFCLSQIFRRGNLIPIAGCDEGIKTKVYTNHFTSFRKWIRNRFDSKRNIPSVVSSCYGKGLDIACYRSMPLYLNAPHILQIKTVILNLAAVSKSGIGNCVKSIRRLKSWIAGHFTSLNSTKESLESLIQSSQCLLKRAIVARCKSFVFLFKFRQKPCSLAGIRYTLASLIVSFFSLGKCLIVKKPMSIKLNSEGFGLRASRVKTVFKRLNHLLPLLARNVVFDNSITHKTNGSDIVTPRPESWNLLLEMLIFAPEFVGSKSFELLNNKMNRQDWFAGNKNMNVIWHNIKSLNCNINLGCLLSKKFLKVFGYIINKHSLTIFRTPYYVIVDIVNASSGYFISFCSHITKFNISLAESQAKYFKKGGYAIPLMAKAIRGIA